MEKYVLILGAEDGTYVRTSMSIAGIQRYLVGEDKKLTKEDICKIEEGKRVMWCDSWGRSFIVVKTEVNKCACCGKTRPLESKYLEINANGKRTYHEVKLCNDCYDKEECGVVIAYIAKSGKVKFKAE